MTQNKIKLLDVVALTIDLPSADLWRGQVGTVVELLADVKLLKWNSEIVMDEPTNRSEFKLIKSCVYTLSQPHWRSENRSLLNTTQRAHVTVPNIKWQAAGAQANAKDRSAKSTI